MMAKYTRLNKINHYHDSGLISPIKSEQEKRNKMAVNDVQKMMTRISNLPKQQQQQQASPQQLITKQSKSSSTTPIINKQILSTKSVANMILVDDDSSKEFNSKHHIYRTRGNVLKEQQHKSCLKVTKKKVSLSKKRLTAMETQFNLKLAFFVFISIFMLILMFVNQVQSLNCYHCSSVDNPDCDEAFTGKNNITETDCEKHIGRPAKVCRKIVQYIEHKKVVIRSCGYIDEHEEKDRKSMCYKRSGTFAIMMESCNCYTDNCNHSASLVPNQSVLFLASCSLIILYSILFLRHNNNQQPHHKLVVVD